MQPLRITAILQTRKVATTDLYLSLDSILAWAWMQENHPEMMDVSQSSIRPEDVVEAELPLERRGQGEDWYWACSFACGQPRGEELVYWHKRFDQALGEDYVDFDGRRGKVDTGAGKYKGYRMPLTTVLIPKLEWYAVGDATEIRRLLSWVTHVGKKPSQGFGRVKRWLVEPWPEDLSHLRAIPDPEGNVQMSVRPPSWLAWAWRRATLSDDPRLACNAVSVGGLQGGENHRTA